MATDEQHLVWCGSDEMPRGTRQEFRKSIHLSTTDPTKNVFLKFENIHRKLAQDIPPIAADLLEIASYVYCADQAITRGGLTSPKNGKNWVRRMMFCVPVRCLDVWEQAEVKKCLEETLGYLSDDHYRFEFREGGDLVNAESYFDFDEGEPWFQADSVLLFSGGLDSLTGALSELVEDRRKVALVSHRPVSKISKRQKELVEQLEKAVESGRFLHVPVWVNKERGLTRDANQRSRSFLYAALGATIANMLGVKGIKFYENGIVSVNLPISEQVTGGRASRSTHPLVLSGMQRLFTLVFNAPFSVENPFLRLTKSDVVGKLAHLRGVELIPYTNSCSHTRSTTKMHTHCGVCSQCIERRIATRHEDVADQDPEYQYETDLFTDSIEDKLDRTMVVEYFQHARRLSRIEAGEFLQQFGEIHRVISALRLPTSRAAELLFDLHRRHGDQVCQVLSSEFTRHADHISRGELNSDCLLAFVAGSQRTQKEKASRLIQFPTPAGTRWEEITIEVTSDTSVRCRVRDVVQSCAALDMGFRDRRTAEGLSDQWELLLVFAYAAGVLSWNHPCARHGKAKPVQELGKILKRYFDIDTSPFRRYSRRTGWVTRFKLTDLRRQG